MQEIKMQVVDAQRQTAKYCVILGGKSLQKRKDREDTVRIVVEAVQEKYGIRIDPLEMSDVHRLPNSEEVIIKFNCRLMGGSYDKMVRRFNNWQGLPNKKNYDIYIRQYLTDYDRTIQNVLLTLKKKKIIESLYAAQSGRLAYKQKDDKVAKTVETIKDIQHLITEEIWKEATTIKPTGTTSSAKRRHDRRKRLHELFFSQVDGRKKASTQHQEAATSPTLGSAVPLPPAVIRMDSIAASTSMDQ